MRNKTKFDPLKQNVQYLVKEKRTNDDELGWPDENSRVLKMCWVD